MYNNLVPFVAWLPLFLFRLNYIFSENIVWRHIFAEKLGERKADLKTQKTKNNLKMQKYNQCRTQI